MKGRWRLIGIALVVAGLAHLLFGVAGLAFPRWFFSAVPPWPPLHVGQLQIGGVFDLSMAALFFATARNLKRYLPLAAFVGVIAEWGNALVRIGHIATGTNPATDLLFPVLMLIFGGILVWSVTRRFDPSVGHAA